MSTVTIGSPTTALVPSTPKKGAKPTSSLSHLPTRNLRHVLEYLPPSDKGSCASTSHRLKILVDYDPTKELQEMGKRRAGKVQPSRTPAFEYGPTFKFMFSYSNQEQRYQVEKISQQIVKDRNVAKTFYEISQIESHYSDYIPLYHAMNLTTFTFSYFTRILLSSGLLGSEKLPTSAPLIRFPSTDGPKTIAELFSRYPVTDSQPYDKIPDVQRELFSLNAHLFTNFFTEGESTWTFYVENHSVAPPSAEAFFKMLQKKYNFSISSDNMAKLQDLQGELCCIAQSFERRNVLQENREYCPGKGMVLQMLVPPSILDKVGYASRPYGFKDNSSRLPLSQRCMKLRKDPHCEPDMQARLLSQSIYVPDHAIQVFTHGCGDFFSEKDPIPLNEVSASDIEKQKAFLARKKDIAAQAKGIFVESMTTRSKETSTST